MSENKSQIKYYLVLLLVLGFFINGFAEGEFKYDSKGKRNPFIPLVTADGRFLVLDKEETKGDLVVEGIVYDKNGRSYALVNGTVVAAADFIGDYQVLKIEPDRVIFIKGGQIREVMINKEGESEKSQKK